MTGEAGPRRCSPASRPRFGNCHQRAAALYGTSIIVSRPIYSTYLSWSLSSANQINLTEMAQRFDQLPSEPSSANGRAGAQPQATTSLNSAASMGGEKQAPFPPRSLQRLTS